MKKTFFYTCLIFVFSIGTAGVWQGCRPESQTILAPVAGQPGIYFITAIIGADSEAGLLINDPISGQQYVTFGKKNAAGEPTSITHIVQTDPETGAWTAHELNPDYTPKSTTTSTGHRVSYSNVNLSNKTANIRVTDTRTNQTVWEQPNAPLNDNFVPHVQNAQALDKAPGFTTVTQAEMVYLLTNAFATGMGIAFFSVSGGGVLAAWSIYNLASNIKSLSEAIENLMNGQPLFGCISDSDNMNALSGIVETFASAQAIGALVVGAIPAAMNYAAQQAGQGQCGSAAARTAGGTANDPVISGLDGSRIMLHPAGEFIAIRSKNDEFMAQVRFEPVGLRPVSTTTSLSVRTGKDVVNFTVKPLQIHVNGQEIKSDFSTYMLADKAYLTRPALNRYEIITTWGDVIEVRIIPTFNISWYVRQLNEKRKNQVEGLLGQFNDNPADDFKDKAGNTYAINKTPKTDFYKKFAHDWRLAQNESILFYSGGKTTESYTKPEFPETGISLFDFDQAARQSAEQTCRGAGITGEPDLSDCMLDVLATGMNEMAEQMGLAFKLRQESAAYFQRLASFPGKSSQSAVALAVENKIYAGLGNNQTDWAMYDPQTDQWTIKAPFTGGKTNYYRMGTFVAGTRIYMVGGLINNTATNALWEYDTVKDEWTRRKDIPGVARYNMAAFSAGGKGYALFGTVGWGLSENDYPTKGTLYEYDPATDEWTVKADFPARPRGNNITDGTFNGTVLVINGRPFVGGGTGSGTVWSDWYEYIPSKNAWEKRANLYGSSYSFSLGNTGYLLSDGGAGKSYLMNYDAVSDTWSKWPGREIYIPLQDNIGRGITQAPVVNGKAYLGLGSSNVPVKDWWSFIP